MKYEKWLDSPEAQMVEKCFFKNFKEGDSYNLGEWDIAMKTGYEIYKSLNKKK
jgi:hypothetical protein